MPGYFLRSAIVVTLACWTLAAQAAEPVQPVVRSTTQLEAVLASGQPSPLDALTPYGKRRFLESLRWSENGVARFQATALVRELDPRQLAAVLAFVGADTELPALLEELDGAPLRMPAPSADAEARLAAIVRAAQADAHARGTAVESAAKGDFSQLERRYMALFGHHVTETRLREMHPADLQPYFDAAVLAARERNAKAPLAPVYVKWADPMRHLLMIHGEMRERKIDTRRTIDATVLRSLIQARAFDLAREFMADKPHLRDTRIPAVYDPLGSDFDGRGDTRIARAGS